jgi:DNA-binding NtrC family response regulator
MLENCQALIIEQEFHIALDMQRILESAGASGVVTARSVGEVDTLRPRWSEFNLAVLAVPRERTAVLALGRELEAAGVAIVFASTDGPGAVGDDRFATARWIGKPFAENDLIAACRDALTGP